MRICLCWLVFICITLRSADFAECITHNEWVKFSCISTLKTEFNFFNCSLDGNTCAANPLEFPLIGNSPRLVYADLRPIVNVFHSKIANQNHNHRHTTALIQTEKVRITRRIYKFVYKSSQFVRLVQVLWSDQVKVKEHQVVKIETSKHRKTLRKTWISELISKC